MPNSRPRNIDISAVSLPPTRSTAIDASSSMLIRGQHLDPLRWELSSPWIVLLIPFPLKNINRGKRFSSTRLYLRWRSYNFILMFYFLFVDQGFFQRITNSFQLCSFSLRRSSRDSSLGIVQKRVQIIRPRTNSKLRNCAQEFRGNRVKDVCARLVSSSIDNS